MMIRNVEQWLTCPSKNILFESNSVLHNKLKNGQSNHQEFWLRFAHRSTYLGNDWRV